MAKDFSSKEAREEVLRLIGVGKTIAEAMKVVGLSPKTYDYWRSTDKEFAAQADRARLLAKKGKLERRNVEVPDFPEFSEKYLHNKLFDHQLQWFDMLEGREPRGLHASMTYEEGRQHRLLVNTPPNHAKSTTITVNYVLWNIVKNPDIKIIIISKAQRLAEQFILQIKERLTSPEYEELQKDFAPSGGWKEGSVSWKANQFYIGGRSSEAKDPTVQAIGMRGQVYGARSDLIIVDDGVDNLNANEYDKQIDWLMGVIASRLTPRIGRLLVIGTRIASKDLYSELRDPGRYYGGTQPWTYLLQPAVLEYAEDPNDWVTLWPHSDSTTDPDEEPDERGLYRRWDGPTLAQVRNETSPSLWSRIYQQEQVSEDSVFKADAVTSACQMRTVGMIPRDAHIGREYGMEGLYLIAGLDPATVGHTAAVLIGVDTRTSERFVIDIFNKAGTKSTEIRELIQNWTLKYGVREWRVERNAFQAYLTRDTEIIQWLRANNSQMVEHYTDRHNKWDPNFGVMSMESLFSNQLIRLPNSSSEVVKSMIEQLVIWEPNPPRGTKTDIVMALWFAEIRAQEMVARLQRGGTYRDTMFTTAGDRQRRIIVGRDEDQARTAMNLNRAWWGK